MSEKEMNVVKLCNKGKDNYIKNFNNQNIDDDIYSNQNL